MVEEVSRTAWGQDWVMEGLWAGTVNLCVNVTGLLDAQIASKTLFLECICEGIWIKLAFDSVYYVKNILRHQWGGHRPVS